MPDFSGRHQPKLASQWKFLNGDFGSSATITLIKKRKAQ